MRVLLRSVYERERREKATITVSTVGEIIKMRSDYDCSKRDRKCIQRWEIQR